MKDKNVIVLFIIIFGLIALCIMKYFEDHLLMISLTHKFNVDNVAYERLIGQGFKCIETIDGDSAGGGADCYYPDKYAENSYLIHVETWCVRNLECSDFLTRNNNDTLNNMSSVGGSGTVTSAWIMNNNDNKDKVTNCTFKRDDKSNSYIFVETCDHTSSTKDESKPTN